LVGWLLSKAGLRCRNQPKQENKENIKTLLSIFVKEIRAFGGWGHRPQTPFIP
jgi:hypothetical protein